MRTFVLIVLLLCTQTAAAEVHKCVDGAGKLSYQDHPCRTDQKPAAANPKAGVVMSKPSSGGTWQENVGDYLESREAERQRARAEQQAAFERENEAFDRSRVPIDPELQRKCELERRSIDRARRGTPSCDQLDRLYGIQKPAKIFVNGGRASRGATTRFDQYGNSYTDFNNGGPLIDQRTGRPCTDLGGGNIRCD
ncbi:MAG: DUF4124 domain-containing protein [Pseudomonadota bacterium]|jgi:hypothetical protein